MNDRVATKEYERWWEEHSATELDQMERNFGEWDTGRKRYPRSLIKKMGYSSILDVGAGLCSEYYGFQHDYPSIAYTATEVTPTFVRLGKEHGVTIVEASAEHLPFKDSSFDVVYIRDVLRHLPTYEVAVREALRVARKEVMLVFGRQLTTKPRDVITYKEDHKIYNNMYSAPLLKKFISELPGVEWSYTEIIEGWKDAPDSLVRVFLEISARDKKRLRLYSPLRQTLFMIKHLIRLLLVVAPRKVVRVVRSRLTS